MSIEDRRAEIDAIDDELPRLLNARARHAGASTGLLPFGARTPRGTNFRLKFENGRASEFYGREK